MIYKRIIWINGETKLNEINMQHMEDAIFEIVTNLNQLIVELNKKTIVDSSTTNGNILINGNDKVVYTHPDKHLATDITQTDELTFISNAERATFNNKADANHSHSNIFTKEEIVDLVGGTIEISHSHNNKEILDNTSAIYTEEKESIISQAVSKSHSHNNKDILDYTEEVFTTELKNKIESNNPSGIITLYNSVLPMLDGWTLCDGSNNTPDLTSVAPAGTVYIMKI